MHIIGTSGHVDHGKTLLIKALTGIDADRLPEEKKRGLTIDLGFAYFENIRGEAVGVIDVPGHERYIRNMVAGAWSLQCALLVVAADDGWMQQSADHLKVLQYLDVPEIVLVISKIDTVSPEQVRHVTEDSLSRISARTGREVPVMPVSSLTGENIEELKILIENILAEVDTADTGTPYVYIDRVFSVKGAGTVVTGSLCSGMLDRSAAMWMLPEQKKVAIRSLQSYYSEAQSIAPVSRVALNLSNVKKEEIHRGTLLTTKPSPFRPVREFIARITIEDAVQLRNHSEIEVAAGTAHRLGMIHLSDKNTLARIVLHHELALKWNQPFVMVRHGGSEIIGGGRAVWIEPSDRHTRQKTLEILQHLPPRLQEHDFPYLSLRIHGYLPKKSAENPDFHKDEVILLPSYFIEKAAYDRACTALLQHAQKPGGIAVNETSGVLEIPDPLTREIIDTLLSEKQLVSNNGILLPPASVQQISPMGRNLVEQAKAGAKQGLEPDRFNIQGAVKECKNLARQGNLVSLDGAIFYHPDIYQACVRDILSGKKPGDRFSIPEAKKRTSLSRKYMIPLLNRMESDGYVKRDENERVVLKGVQED